MPRPVAAWAGAAAAAVLLPLAGVVPALTESKQFLPHITCYLRDPRLVWVNATTDTAIGLSYVVISLVLTLLVHRGRRDIPFSWVFLAFGLFIVACGATHFMEVVTLWKATYWLSATLKIVTAVASVATALVLPPLIPKALALVRAAKKSEERLRALEREKSARAEAEEASRAKDAFLATLSHELRTPMTAILGWSAMLRAGTLDENMAHTAVQAIEKSAKSQAQLIDDLLDVSRIVTGKLAIDLQPTDLSSAVRSAVETNGLGAARKEIRLEVALPPGAVTVSADPARLQQIISNLLSNAVKFTPKGGSVRVEVEREAEEARIVVSDTGIGISPEFLPSVFDRFTQADATTTRGYSGLGLGLAIVRHLTDLHGGSVAAESDGAGKGARVTVRLPLLHAQAGGNATRAAEKGTRLDGLHILLVEDEPLSREMLEAALSTYGATVRSVASAAEGLLAAGERMFDAIVTDIAMPDEDGVALLRALRATSWVPIIAVSALSLTDDKSRIAKAGFDDYLQKPVTPAALAEAIARLTGTPT